MKIGVLADVHGNLTALEAVLEDARREGISHYILLGDLFAKGPSPLAVYEKLKALSIIGSVQGNTDTWFIEEGLDERQKTLVAFGKHEMSKEQHSYIEALPTDLQMNVLGHTLYLVHMQEEVLETWGQEAEMILSANTHIPISWQEAEGKIVNPGSVGCSYDNNNFASYGILEIKETLDFRVRRVAYNIEKEKRLAIEKQLPYVVDYFRQIEKGQR